MADIIHLLPDAVANQIAAGEVVQRPASVVKELMENSVDAGATSIQVNIKDAGKTLIQVIDNGCGMSQTDARLAFERHATSKIKNAKDLFSIRTMGFRGEALASIAAIAHVELKTKKHEEEIGTSLKISGSTFVSQESIACKNGSNFIVKDIFYNTPARRNFLRSNTTELQHILYEFQRIALSHTTINFELYHNNNLVYKLPKLGLKKTILQLFGKRLIKKLLTISVETSHVKITGYIGTPESAKKRYGHQFFFLNNRYIKHPYLHRAVLKAYEKLIQPTYLPVYFLHLEVNPAMIDINIHPTKTMVKFENEPAFFQIMNATVSEALGKFNFTPAIDFTEDHSIKIPIFKEETKVQSPHIEVNPVFDPFEKDKKFTKKQPTAGWTKLYEDETDRSPIKKPSEAKLFKDEEFNFFQFKQQYILVQVKSGLMLIDQKRAHIRILYENLLEAFRHTPINSQQLLYEEKIHLSQSEYFVLYDFKDYFTKIGFNLDFSEEGSILVKGTPQGQTIKNLKAFFEETAANFVSKESQEEPYRRFANAMAKVSAVGYGVAMGKLEMETLFNELFSCKSHLYTPDGQKIVHIIGEKEIRHFLT